MPEQSAASASTAQPPRGQAVALGLGPPPPDEPRASRQALAFQPPEAAVTGRSGTQWCDAASFGAALGSLLNAPEHHKPRGPYDTYREANPRSP